MKSRFNLNSGSSYISLLISGIASVYTIPQDHFKMLFTLIPQIIQWFYISSRKMNENHHSERQNAKDYMMLHYMVYPHVS